MAFPRPGELKHIPFTEDQERDLINYMDTELHRAEGDRQGLIDRLDEEVRLYEAVPEVETKMSPWEGASNLVVPIIGAMVDTIYPRVYSTVFGVEPTFTLEERLADWAEHAKDVQDLLEIVQEVHLNMPKVSQSWFLESILHGTSVVKLVWDDVRTGMKKYGDDGTIETVDEEVKKFGPGLYRVPLEHFYIPSWAQSIEDAPWVAHRIRTYWGRLQALEASGVYKDIDLIEHRIETTSTDHERTRERLEDASPQYQEEYEIFEWWGDYDFDNDGVEERLLITYHMPTQTIIRAHFNPYWHRRKPFREFEFWPRHDRWGGIGIARMVAPIQDEVSTLHNQGIDNRTAGNTRMWEVVAGSQADLNFDGTAPGRKIKVDQLDKEIKPLEFASKADGFSDAEDIALRYAQQRTGVSDFLSGLDMGKGGGRETATTTMVRMQEARTRFNWTMDSARMAMADIAQMTVTLLQQFGDDMNFESLLGDEAAGRVREFLALPEDEVREHGKVSVTASSASMNKEAEKQNIIALQQLNTQHTLNYELPLVQIILNPQAPPELKEYAMEKIRGSRLLSARILQTFDAKNTDAILGSLVAIEAIIGQTGPQGAPGLGGQAGPPQPFEQPNVGVPTEPVPV